MDLGNIDSIEYSGNARLIMREEGLSQDQVAEIIHEPDRVITGSNKDGTVVAEGDIDNQRVMVVLSTEPSTLLEGHHGDVVVLSAMVIPASEVMTD